MCSLVCAGVSSSSCTLADFCTTYIDKLSEAYNYGFGVASPSAVIVPSRNWCAKEGIWGT